MDNCYNVLRAQCCMYIDVGKQYGNKKIGEKLDICASEYAAEEGNQVMLCRGLEHLSPLQITVSLSHIKRAE